MITGSLGPLSVVASILATLALPFLAIWVLSFVLRFVFAVVGGVFRFAGRTTGRVAGFARAEVKDGLQLAGGALTGSVIAPLALGNLAIGRVRSAKHFARAIEDEYMGAAISLYRVALGNPARFLGLSALTDGLERRLPDLVASSPIERPRGARAPQGPPAFDGYTVRSEMAAGGSGARLFLARPSEPTRRRYLEAGHPDPGQVVLKSFALGHGSTLPQIVRESRALMAARRLGLVLDHQLSDDSFWYAMPFVPGEDLDVVTRRMHAQAEPEGLGRRSTQKLLGYASDLLETLDRFHREGLWHKDIKPSNLIVSGDRVHLVDLGLVTPLASAMTLTTHGTEYFRDPELVRRAMQGVKVCDVDGVKFDLYSAGAVLYSMVENSFPAHGSLSRISKRCPDALAFVVRRAMADIDQRYASAEEMGRDVRALIASPDPFAVRPADLPSMGGRAPVAAPLALAGLRKARPEDRVDLEEVAAAFAPEERGGDARPSRSDARAARRGRRRRTLAALGFAFLVAGMSSAVLADRGQRVHVSRIARARADRAMEQIQGTVRRTASLPQPAPAPSLPEGRVLLLRDPSVPSDHRELQALKRLLESKGSRVLDDMTDDVSALEIVAGGQRAVELAPLNDPDAVRRLDQFLQRTPDLDGIVWLGGPDGATAAADDHLQYRSLVR